ncbi:LysR family transcriptional regulator [Orrella sp. JC864]|uniref:LysR family transcriptional regulator n=1 Tax=Orrella sp. JC864 TaxID=3120298 RepID=UPI00300B363E
MTLKQLEAFYAAATAASFALAATQLHLSQSSLSKRIGDLERHLGRVLFDRSGHRATLTQAGRELLPRAREILAAADALQAAMGQQAPLAGICRFGVGELAAMTWLPRFVARCRRDFPELRLEPHVDLGQALEERLESGELDFAVVAGWSSRSTLVSQTIAKVRYGWAGAPELLRGHARITPRTLQETVVITMPPGAGSTRIFDAWVSAHNLDVPRRLTCNNMTAIAGLVSAGVGIGFFPEGWLRPLAERGAVQLLESDPPLRSLHYSFQCRRDDIRAILPALRERVMQEVDFSAPHPLR